MQKMQDFITGVLRLQQNCTRRIYPGLIDLLYSHLAILSMLVSTVSSFELMSTLCTPAALSTAYKT